MNAKVVMKVVEISTTVLGTVLPVVTKFLEEKKLRETVEEIVKETLNHNS